MALVRRMNCEYEVPEYLVEEYLAKGYSLIDEKGRMLKDCMPQNIGDYKELADSLHKQIEALKVKSAAKDAEISELRDKLKEKDEEVPQTEPAAPATKRTVKKT